jgi:exopolysaccharide biosynthesis polyprenyl glycosylphosphotransferase
MKSTLSSGSLRSLNQRARIRSSVRTEYFLLQITLVLLDFLLINLAFRAAYYIRFISAIPFFRDSIIPQITRYKDFMILAIPIWIVIFAVYGLYTTRNLLGGFQEYSRLLTATSIGMLLIISLGFLMPNELILARGWVILAWLLSFFFTAIGRFFMRRFIYALRKIGHFQDSALIIGVNEEGQLLAEQILNWRTSGIRLAGYVNEHPNQALDENLHWLGRLQDLEKIIEKYEVSEIILTSSALSQEQILMLFRKYGTAKNINLRMSSGLYEIITTGMQISENGPVPLVTINKVRMAGWDMIMKLFMDYLIAIPVVILLLPFLGIVALAIRLDSPGPIIYRRRVMGVNGQKFDAFKFRTMCVNSDEVLNATPELVKEYQANYKLKNDPRVTRVGKYLRKTSIDELPQLFNVLRNEMSLVGPRMICPEELNKYHQWDINLLTVKPGITGMWQVRGRSDVGYEERVKLDMFYIRNWTPWLDLQLLMQTIPAVLSKRGAY